MELSQRGTRQSVTHTAPYAAIKTQLHVPWVVPCKLEDPVTVISLTKTVIYLSQQRLVNADVFPLLFYFWFVIHLVFL